MSTSWNGAVNSGDPVKVLHFIAAYGSASHIQPVMIAREALAKIDAAPPSIPDREKVLEAIDALKEAKLVFEVIAGASLEHARYMAARSIAPVVAAIARLEGK